MARLLWVVLPAVLVTVGLMALLGIPDRDAVETAVAIRDRITALTPAPRSAERSGIADGYIGTNSVSVDDADLPAVSGLDRDLLEALRAATRDARADGVRLLITSGWRSRAYQQRLLDDAIDTYGSRAEARRWVATPDESAHVTGDAVDIGPTQAAYWMLQHGADYGLCQAYTNEIWHYELLTQPGSDCPVPRQDGATALAPT
jgi:zinc D-Ala-D-Ala carboxypeptidase